MYGASYIIQVTIRFIGISHQHFLSYSPQNETNSLVQSTGSFLHIKKPLKSTVFHLARVAGFEPAHDGIRIRCLTAWRYPNDWRRHPDLNWGIKVLQTSALPLGYVAELYGVDSGIRTHAYRSHNPGS